MLKSITIQNFKSYDNATLPIAPLTVLIGANASGKSNFIEAMRIANFLALGSKLSSIQYEMNAKEINIRGTVRSLANKGRGFFKIACELSGPELIDFHMAISTSEGSMKVTREAAVNRQTNKQLYNVIGSVSGKASGLYVEYDNFKKGRNKPQIICSDQTAIFTQLSSPSTFKNEDELSKDKIPKVAALLETSFSNILFLDPVPAKMRDYSFPSDKKLRGDGFNISAVIYNLIRAKLEYNDNDSEAERNKSEHNYNQLLEFIQSLPEQEIEGIGFLKEERGGVMVALAESFGSNKQVIYADSLSDGTLRVLAVAAAILSAEPGCLVVIEEIDNGVHPSRAKHLLNLMLNIAHERNVRVLLTTHNPVMLDALPTESIPNVVFCYREKVTGSSNLVRLDDLDRYPSLIAQGSLGNLLTAGVIDRFVKNPTTPEGRKTQFQNWLRELDEVVE